jgi:membrane protease YdiL (CAAX protease family)
MNAPDSRDSEPTGVRFAPLPAYLIAVAITILTILSQYFLPENLPFLGPVYHNLATHLLLVYGLPILAFGLLVGGGPLARFFSNSRLAVVEGLRWYGAMGVLGLVAAFAIVAVLAVVDPTALSQLNRPNPVLEAARSDPWFWVGFSFVIGIVEETIFRGWIFGYWLQRDASHWSVHAVWTSLLFASVHLYYGSTYGLASGVAFAELFFSGLGFAVAVRSSKGNLLVVGLLHGAHDALSFSTLVWNPWGEELYYLLILIGALVFIATAWARDRARQPLVPWRPGAVAPTPPAGGNPAIVWPPSSEGVYDRPSLPTPPPPTPPGSPPG